MRDAIIAQGWDAYAIALIAWDARDAGERAEIMSTARQWLAGCDFHDDWWVDALNRSPVASDEANADLTDAEAARLRKRFRNRGREEAGTD